MRFVLSAARVGCEPSDGYGGGAQACDAEDRDRVTESFDLSTPWSGETWEILRDPIHSGSPLDGAPNPGRMDILDRILVGVIND